MFAGLTGMLAETAASSLAVCVCVWCVHLVQLASAHWPAPCMAWRRTAWRRAAQRTPAHTTVAELLLTCVLQAHGTRSLPSTRWASRSRAGLLRWRWTCTTTQVRQTCQLAGPERPQELHPGTRQHHMSVRFAYLHAACDAVRAALAANQSCQQQPGLSSAAALRACLLEERALLLCRCAAAAGNSWDLSSAVMDRALMHADGVYKFPAQRVRGHMCRTNIASNTAFRGFGGPQVGGCVS